MAKQPVKKSKKKQKQVIECSVDKITLDSGLTLWKDQQAEVTNKEASTFMRNGWATIV